MNPILAKLLKKFTGWIDPKLEQFRPKQPPYTPRTSKELMGVLRRTPKEVLSDRERDIVIAATNFRHTRIQELMIPRSEITFVHENEMLGPLMLDKLYKSGFSHFPIVDARRKVIGVLHTEALMSLAIKETARAKEYIDPHVYYARQDYTLEQALNAFARTNCNFLLVVDHDAKIVGLINHETLVRYLLGSPDNNDLFDHDSDPHAVASRDS